MKKIFYSLLLLVALGSVLFVNLLPKQSVQYGYNFGTIYSKLKDIESVYNDKLFLALYSLPDFKYRSIVQFETTSKKYDNTWLSPSVYADLLNHEEKQLLIQKTCEYLEKSEDSAIRCQMISKLKNWCLAESQMNFLTDRAGISRSNLIETFADMPKTGELISSLKSNQNQGTSELVQKDYERAYFEVINYLSEKTNKEQMLYYSDLYRNLSCIAQK